VPYTWDKATRKYHDDKGKPISQGEVRRRGLRVVNKSKEAMGKLSEAFNEGAITFEEWAVGMREGVKASHSAMVQLAYGGKDQMGPMERGRLGAVIRDQYKYLGGFLLEVETGQVEGDGLRARAEMYAEASWGSHESSVAAREKAAGATEERSFMEPEATHCQDCFDEASKGWVPIGSLTPIGERQCLARCQCNMEFRERGLGEDEV
jgi:hypothetical protein